MKRKVEVGSLVKEYCAWIPTADILQPSINNRCCHAVSDETETPEYLAQTAQDPTKLAECLAWPNCGGTVKRRLEHVDLDDRFDMIKATLRYDGKYEVYNGRHRACFAKRTGVEKVWAKVVEWAPDEAGYILPDIVTSDEFCTELVVRQQYHPWAGAELFICGVGSPWHPIRFRVHRENEWVGVNVEEFGARSFDNKPAPLTAMATKKRNWFSHLLTQSETLSVAVKISQAARRNKGIGMARYVEGRCVSFEVLHRSRDWTLGTWQPACRADEAKANPWFYRAMRQLPILPMAFTS